MLMQHTGGAHLLLAVLQLLVACSSKACMCCAAGPLEGAVALDKDVASLINGLITDGKP